VVKLRTGEKGSVTIGGTVSPAGGNFEEPVTQATLKVVGAFHGLSRERSDARKYPSIHPLDSWSKYEGPLNKDLTDYAKEILFQGDEIGQMMKVIGEEGTSTEDYILYLKSDFLDSVYLQQNSFDPVDASVSTERQRHVFDLLFDILGAKLSLESKDEARQYFYQLRQKFIDYNGSEEGSGKFKTLEQEIISMLESKKSGIESKAKALLSK
jgi:V/A-type H+-transporting ATPase subunit A